MRQTAYCRRWLVGLFFFIALVGIIADEDEDEEDDEDVFEDPDEPIPVRKTPEKPKKKATGLAREYNPDGTRKKRAYDHDDIDEVVLQEQENEAHALYERATEMHSQAKKWGGEEALDTKAYDDLLKEAERKLVEVWEDGKPSERSLLLLGMLNRRERVEKEQIDDRTMEERMMQSATYYYAAASRYNSTEGLYNTGKIVQMQADLKGRQGDEEKQKELYRKANEFYGAATHRGSVVAMTEFAEMCANGKGWPDEVCPHDVASEVYRFFEHLANNTPGGITYSKVAYAWANGLGKPRIDMPEACNWNAKAVEANDKAIKDMGGKVKISELENKGIAVEAYLMRSVCLYCGGYTSVGSPDSRTDARNSLKKMFRLQNLKKDVREKKLKETAKEMFGPAAEPDLVATLRWDRDVEKYGLRWFIFIWGEKKIAFIYSQSRRETHKCDLEILKAGEKEDYEVPIFQCSDGSLRLMVTDINEDGKMKGICRTNTKSGVVQGAFDMESPIPQHAEM